MRCWPQPPSVFNVKQRGRPYCSADERHHRGCRLSQGDQEHSTIGKRGIGGVKVSSHQKYTTHVVHSPVKHVGCHFKFTNILGFIHLHFILLLRSLPLLSPLFYGKMQQWLTCSFQSICLFLPHPFPICHFPPLLLPRAVDPSWMQQRFYMWKQEVEIFKRELSCLKTSFPLERKDYNVLFAWTDRRLITQGLLWQRRART